MKNSIVCKSLQVSVLAFSSLVALAPASIGRELPENSSCDFGNWNRCERNRVEIPNYQYAEGVRQLFYCGVSSDGIPTTFVRNSRGTFPVVRWVSRIFDDAGYVPETRCRQVSSKFQQFYERGLLNYVTSGRVNQQPVICVSNRQEGPCLGILFTLKPEQNAQRTLQQLFDIRSNASAGPLEESQGRFYLDLNQYIETQGSVSEADAMKLD